MTTEVLFHRTSQALGQVFLAFRAPAFRLHFGGALWGQDTGRQPVSSIPSHFKMNQRHRIEARIFMILYTRMVFRKYGHAQELLLGDFPEPSLAQQDRHPPKCGRSLRKSSAAGSFHLDASRSRSRRSGLAGPTRSNLAPSSHRQLVPTAHAAGTAAIGLPGSGVFAQGRMRLLLPGRLTAQPGPTTSALPP